MSYTLTPDLQQMVQELLATGRYQSTPEVLGEALSLLKSRDDQLQQLRREVQLGVDALDRGEYRTYSDSQELVEEIKAEGLRRLAAMSMLPRFDTPSGPSSVV